MGEMKEFPLADVLGAITGVLLGKIGGVYAISEFMSGEPVWTHQLPRVCREICPVVLRQHPHLAPVISEAAEVNPDNWQDKLDGWITQFGATITLVAMTNDEHQSIDPLSELAEKIHPDQIIVARTHADR